MTVKVKSQFHYGSIQTYAVILQDFKIDIVTIPLWFDSNNGSLSQRGFFSQRHNSTMVRFKLLAGFSLIIKFNKSQFHYGSIQTFLLLSFDNVAFPSHNSTMVRFKLDWSLVNFKPLFLGHNSTMVRFKLNICLPVLTIFRKSHNSTMVRFKRNLFVGVFLSYETSQFHYGSIQTVFDKVEVKKCFSRHNSTMVRFKQSRPKGHLKAKIRSQFHYGSIQTVYFYVQKYAFLFQNQVLC